MQLTDLKAEIAALEIQTRHLEKILDQSIRNNEVLGKTKVIFHDLKLATEKLERLRQMTERATLQ